MNNDFWKIQEDDGVLEKSFKGIVNALTHTLLEFITYWYLYLPALILAGFSGFAMFFVTGGRVESGQSGWVVTQSGNLLYIIIGVIFSEPYCIHWFIKLEVHENKSQKYAAFLGLIASLATSILTGWSAAEIIAKMTSSEIFTLYKQLDIWTQNYIVHLAPVAAFVHMLLGGWYRAVSGEAAARRNIRKSIQELRVAKAQFDANVAQQRTATAQSDLARFQNQLGTRLGHDDARQTEQRYSASTVAIKDGRKSLPADTGYKDLLISETPNGLTIKEEGQSMDPTRAER